MNCRCARHATLSRFLDRAGNPIDIGIALFFPGPLSYTGEHVLELQGHGGPVIVEQLIERCLELGARRARPGEFTERAFHNDKIDLAQAEAVADLIDAGSREAARAAMRSLQGEFSSMVQGLTDALIDLRTYVEAAIDFPEEEVDFLGDAELRERLATVRGHFDGIVKAASQGRLLRDGMTVVLAGRPNSGKSSLLNRLAGYEAAIVTAIPGTTRDVLRERIDIDGLPLHVLDTAGLRDSDDVVEREGVRRASAEMSRADRVLFVIDTADDPRRPRIRRRKSAPARGRARDADIQQDRPGRGAARRRHHFGSAAPSRLGGHGRGPRSAACAPERQRQLSDRGQRQHLRAATASRGAGAARATASRPRRASSRSTAPASSWPKNCARVRRRSRKSPEYLPRMTC